MKSIIGPKNICACISLAEGKIPQEQVGTENHQGRSPASDGRLWVLEFSL